MRWAAIVVILAASFCAFAKETSLEDMIARAETAPPGDRPALYVEIAEHELKSADEAYTAGKADQGQAAVKNVVTYSEKAHDAALQSGKRLKGTEIALRKMAAKLQDIKRTLSFEDQPPLQSAAERLENLRTDLLGKTFGKNK